ncbi:hypothetical protein QFC21_005987 [Naganishia friedmannii]|uniref:Uncharacterized protein n=1 Tax=Naganishia friedmannii TaxID=89922 RepID=A0ACC2V515_9TREE|nr:hypothetical protein QFC21_005987 [Naganishia friedmannii]
MSADIPNQGSMRRLGRLAKNVVQALKTGMSTLGVNEDTDVFDEEGTGDEKFRMRQKNGVTPAAEEAEVPAESEATPTSESPISLWILTRKATKGLRRQKKVDITWPKAPKVHRSHK